MKTFQALPTIMITLLISSTYSHANDALIPIDYLNSYPSELQAEFDELKDMCESVQYGDAVDFPLNVQSGFITRSDVTGDGIDDYIVHTGKLSCEYGRAGSSTPLYITQFKRKPFGISRPIPDQNSTLI